MKRLSDISTIREVMEKNGFSFSKALGQNFLINPSVCPRMAEMSGAADCAGAIEVGPGIGVLTYELSQVSKKVVSVELDKRLLPVLGETLADCDNVKIINDDVMKIDLHKVIEEEFGGEEVAVCANLPYYITSPVIMRLLEERLPITNVTVMVQKEAADRLCAKPGTRACGAVSAAVQYYAEPEILFDVSRGSFMPAPNVDSAVIRLKIRKTPAVEVADEKLFFRLVKAAFAQRRKTAVNSISNTMGMKKQAVIDAFAAAGIEGNARAEALTLEQFASLTNCLASVE
ncbi:MAG: 16S rRNA (adenine(1518)-N(6)/adenine(1519)-N(6))-dimethyltransferase RsmA [Clostridia bacterium]|nr:16S rRNA (adenine(1518)-N(6)/adenine(1519)-N(6))-dimethyltransferase RsmA [Clostridia bacterium]